MGHNTVNAAERFPPITRQIMSSVRSTEADIERFAKAPPGAPLGRIAFSPERIKRERIPYEPNTDIEQALKKDVWSYVHDNVDFKPESIGLIKQLVAQGYYGDVIRFTDPSIGTVYRGFAIEADAIPSEFGFELSNRMSRLNLEDIATFDASLTFRPWNRSGISSWSTVPSIGVNFASDSSSGMEGKVYMIVFHAQIADNSDGFLDAFNLFNKINVTNPQLLAQREQFGMGNIKVSKVTVAVIDADDFGSGRAIGPRMEAAVKAGTITSPLSEMTDLLKPWKKRLSEGGKRYWGIGGAGVVYVCPDDGTVFLQKRSSALSMGGGKWAFPGGGILIRPTPGKYPQDQGTGHWTTPIPSELALADGDKRFEDTALEEVMEECGSLPSLWRFVDNYIYEDEGFKYKTFIATVPLASKEAWMPEPQEAHAWESAGTRWFTLDEFEQLESQGKLFFGFTEELKSKVIRAMTGS
jgi:8-oxo-dGTP pyrophosphatase MutT (NUDIX family)